MTLPRQDADPSRALPYWQRQPETWAEEQVADSHREALYLLGEYTMFVLMWHAVDHERGLVARCSRCFGTHTHALIAEAYRQPVQERCPVCFGTTFEGGWRARIIRPALWTDSATDTVEHPRGDVQTDSMSVETTEDFTLRRGDYVFRADGTRFRTMELVGAPVRTGFAQPVPSRSVGGAIAQVRLEDPTTVAYLIPPDRADLVEALAVPATAHLVPDLSATYEEANGPLLLPVF